MRFNCNGLSLAEAVLKVSKACAVRTTAPIMECIKITATSDGISLLATDGELSIEKFLNAEVLEEGATCVPGKLFSDFISKLSSEEIDVATGEKGVEISYRDSKSYMQALPAEEFPVINLSAGENSFVMKQSAFKDIVAEVVFCCSGDDSRPILKGCLMEMGDNLKMTALDGYRLAFSQAPILAKSSAKNMICPARTLNEIAKMLSGDEDAEVTLFEENGQMLVKSDGMTIVSRLYRGDFIKRENVVPSKFSTEVTLNRAELMASAERAAILIRGDKNNLVTLEITSDRVKISSISDYGNVSEAIEAETDGVDLTISMNAKYLLDALRALKEDKVVISFNGAISPFILQNEEKKDSLYLILPVKNAS